MVDLPITKWIKKKIRRLIGIVEDTDVATHSIASGKYVVWKGDLCKSTEPIAVGGALSLSNLSPVSDGGFNELSEQIGKIGTVVSGTNAQSLDVPSGTTVNICSMQLNAGTWIISGGHQWTTDFSDMKICSIRMETTTIDGTMVRYNAGAGGGAVTTCIITLTTTKTINLSAYQGSGTSKTVRSVSLKAVRIA